MLSFLCTSIHICVVLSMALFIGIFVYPCFVGHFIAAFSRSSVPILKHPGEDSSDLTDCSISRQTAILPDLDKVLSELFQASC